MCWSKHEKSNNNRVFFFFFLFLRDRTDRDKSQRRCAGGCYTAVGDSKKPAGPVGGGGWSSHSSASAIRASKSSSKSGSGGGGRREGVFRLGSWLTLNDILVARKFRAASRCGSIGVGHEGPGGVGDTRRGTSSIGSYDRSLRQDQMW